MSTDKEAAAGGGCQPEGGGGSGDNDDDDDGRVPIVDLTPLRAGGAAGKAAVAAAIKRCGCVGCSDVAGWCGSRCSTYYNHSLFHAIGTHPTKQRVRDRGLLHHHGAWRPARGKQNHTHVL